MVKAKIYNDLKLPARVYFEIIETNNYKLLKKTKGKAKKKKLLKNWLKINDEVFKRRNIQKNNLLIRLQKDLILLIRKKEIAKLILKALFVYNFDENSYKEIAEALKKIDIVINPNNSKLQEIHDVLLNQIGVLDTEVKLLEDEIKNLTKGEKVSFLETIVLFEEYGYKVEEEVSLEKYLIYEKNVKEKAKRNK